MPIDTDYFLTASMDVSPEAEALFNEVYDTEHVPFLSEVPGVLSIARFSCRELMMSIGGEVVIVPPGDAPRYTAVYELADPSVLVSEKWAAAIERGRWAKEVRPHTTNRRHLLLGRLHA